MHLTFTIYYTIISKIQKFAKNSKKSPLVKPYSLYPIKQPYIISKPLNETLGVDAFCRYHILNHYLKNFKNSPKIQKLSDRQKKHNPYSLYPTKEPCVISIRLSEYPRRRCILKLTYIISLFQKFKNSPKIQT